jgi:hypothetical protein
VLILCESTFQRNVWPPSSGQKNPRARNQCEQVAADCYVCSHLLRLVPRSRNILPWRWSRYVHLKRRFTQDQHSATSQKAAFFTVHRCETSNFSFLVFQVVFPLRFSDCNFVGPWILTFPLRALHVMPVSSSLSSGT